MRQTTQASGLGRRVSNSLASPLIANELDTRHPNPRSLLSPGPMLRLDAGIKDLAGKAFSYVSIGETDEKAFPARADHKDEHRIAASIFELCPKRITC